MVFFDPAKEEAAQEFDNIPPGTYRVAVIDSQVKPTKKGDGEYMAVAFQILDGKYKDRRVMTNFNLKNPSEQAMKIGRAEFKRFLETVGVTQALNSENEAHKAIANKTLSIEVSHRVMSDGKTWTDVKKFIPKDGAASVGVSPHAGKPMAADPDIPF